jgi:glycosyltransferase involved in cell wall biosynthesis
VGGTSGRLFWGIKSWSFKYADLCIVSNEGLIPDIRALSHNFYVLPDKIPQVPEFSLIEPVNDTCVYVNSFAVDEPHQEVLAAARGLNRRARLFFTGKVPTSFNLLKELPANVYLTGFLPDNVYFKLLKSAGCILALTSEEDCLQCGAYEALALGVPMVLSDTLALRSYFGTAAVYVKNEASEICYGIEKALHEKDCLRVEARKIKELRTREFNLKLKGLTKKIHQLTED